MKCRRCVSVLAWLRSLWLIMHLSVSIWYFLLSLVNALKSFLISSGFLKSYRDLDISKVQYLAVVIDSEEAPRTTKVLHLLRWLEAIGIKKVCLYDTEGVLKKSKEPLSLWLKSVKISKMGNTQLPKQLIFFERSIIPVQRSQI